MVTIEDVKERLEHYKRLELTGPDVPGMSAGPPAILWSIDQNEDETWEVLPEWFANLALADFAQSGEVARAAVYRKPPDRAPFDVVRKWTIRILEAKQR